MLLKVGNLNFLFLVLLIIFNATFAVPVDNTQYSVEEQDPSEQIANVDDKDYEAEKQIYELQFAVWPTDVDQSEKHEHESSQPTVVDNQHAPVYEEQEIAYPTQVENNEENEQNLLQPQGSSGQSIPVWQHEQTTKRPIQHVVQSINVTPTWQQSSTSTTTKSVSQEIPVWIYPHNTVNPQQTAVVHPVATVPVWQQPIASTQAPVPEPIPPQTSISNSPTSQNPLPVPIFPNFGEAESIAESQNNAATNNHFPVNGFNNVHSISKPTKRPQPPVEVVEQFHVVKPSGITEYKLVLSNGMTNYKKIYNKLLPNGKIVTVQEGYDSVPIPSNDPNSNNYQTQYYIADEFGHNVYRIEKQTRKPKFPNYLDYKQQGGQF